MPQPYHKLLSLFRQIESDYCRLERKIGQLKNALPFYSTLPEILIKSVKRQQLLLDTLKQESLSPDSLPDNTLCEKQK